MSTTIPTPPAVSRSRRGRLGDLKLALLMILPASIGLVLFLLWPLARGIWLSFTDFNLLTEPSFVGFNNYIRMAKDPIFWNAAWVTIEYVVINIGVQTIVALLIAVLMHRLTKSTFIRSIVLTPYLVSNVVAALLFLWILDTQLGVANQVISAIGLDRIPFLADEAYVIPTIALINVWRHMGYTALLIFAGLQSIPESVYEAGRVDGASEWSMFRKITIPLLRPILALVLIMTVIGSFQVFDTVAVTTSGGPVNSSRVLQLYIYDMAFGRFQFGYASALSVALLVILLIVSIIQYRLMRAGETDLN